MAPGGINPKQFPGLTTRPLPLLQQHPPRLGPRVALLVQPVGVDVFRQPRVLSGVGVSFYDQIEPTGRTSANTFHDAMNAAAIAWVRFAPKGQ